MEVTKVPVYVALKVLWNIRLESLFLFWTMSDLVLYCSSASVGRKMKAAESKLMLQWAALNIQSNLPYQIAKIISKWGLAVGGCCAT